MSNSSYFLNEVWTHDSFFLMYTHFSSVDITSKNVLSLHFSHLLGFKKLKQNLGFKSCFLTTSVNLW